jgi:hypothetical protein
MAAPLADRSFEEKLAPQQQNAATPEGPIGDSILEVRLVAHLRSFIRRAAVSVRDTDGAASFTVTLMQPGGDDDGTLCLEASIKETMHRDRQEGRIPGVPFDRVGS